MKLRNFLAAAALSLGCIGGASAQEWYVGGAIGLNAPNDSDNSGETGAFTTGNGAPALPFGTPIASGTPYGWTTEFDNGLVVSGEVGARYAGGLRSGIELSYTQSDVSNHSGVNVAGTVIDGVDAAVLTGSPTQLGVTVGAVVANPEDDELTNTAVFANLYYDFARGTGIEPYVGAGIGFSNVEVTYQPSGVGIIDDSDTVLAYQVKVGATWAATPKFDLYGEFAYRATEDVEFDNNLFPGTLEIENQQNLFLVGARMRFGAGA